MGSRTVGVVTHQVVLTSALCACTVTIWRVDNAIHVLQTVMFVGSLTPAKHAQVDTSSTLIHCVSHV